MFELVINNGQVIDPVKGKFKGNLGIERGKITEISCNELRGKKVIDAKHKLITPGFIDIHMHEDKRVKNDIEFEIFNSMSLMGVTTVVGGNCGLGDNNIGKYFNILEKKGSPVNYVGLIGQNTLREQIGLSDNDRYRPASREEINKMSELIKKGFAEGAAGISFGLEYHPGISTEEILVLSELVASYPDKIISAHYRFDASRSLEAIAEMIIVARETGVKFQISHIGSCTAFGQMEAGLKMLTAANKSGVNIMADVYPYDAFSTHIGSAVFDEGCFERWNVSYNAIEIAEGKFKGQRCTEEIFKKVREQEPDVLAIAFVLNEEEVVKALQHPLIMIASDGLISNGQGHPRAAGAFPRVLGRYVREQEKLSLINAITKMTLMPAKRLGLAQKGRIKIGYDADITIFDNSKIMDKATFAEPIKPPEGIENVIVRGLEVVCDGELTGRLPGVVLKNE